MNTEGVGHYGKTPIGARIARFYSAANNWGTPQHGYVQIVVDLLCSLAFAEVYTAKVPVTAAELL